MKLWIDDMRDAPDDTWTVVRKVQPALAFLHQFCASITDISIDHDIENRPDDETFLPIAYYIGLLYSPRMWLNAPKIRIHSDNPVGARTIVNLLSEHGLVSRWEPYTTQAEFAAKYGL